MPTSSTSTPLATKPQERSKTRNAAIHGLAPVLIKLMVILSPLLGASCSTIYRLEISPVDGSITGADKNRFESVLLDHGFSKVPWNHERIFGPAVRLNQKFISYFGKDYYIDGKKWGGTEVWVVEENTNLVAYLIGDSRDTYNQTGSFAEYFLSYMKKNHSDLNSNLSKKYFMDLR